MYILLLKIKQIPDITNRFKFMEVFYEYFQKNFNFYGSIGIDYVRRFNFCRAER
jgi:hypothetical protein